VKTLTSISQECTLVN